MKRYENWELNTYIEKKIIARPNKSNMLSTIVQKTYRYMPKQGFAPKKVKLPRSSLKKLPAI